MDSQDIYFSAYAALRVCLYRRPGVTMGPLSFGAGGKSWVRFIAHLNRVIRIAPGHLDCTGSLGLLGLLYRVTRLIVPGHPAGLSGRRF